MVYNIYDTIKQGVNIAQGHRKLELTGPGNLWSPPDVSSEGTVFPLGCDLPMVTHRKTNLSPLRLQVSWF